MKNRILTLAETLLLRAAHRGIQTLDRTEQQIVLNATLKPYGPSERPVVQRRRRRELAGELAKALGVVRYHTIAEPRILRARASA